LKTQSKLKYERLLAKSEEMFVANGYRGISLEDIAAAAGISKVTIYKYFASKEELFIAIVLKITDGHYELLQAGLDARMCPAEKLRYTFEFNLKAYRQYSTSFYKDMMDVPHIWERVIDYRKKKAKDLFESILTEGSNSERLRKLNVKHTMNLLLCLGECLPQLFPFDDHEEAESFLETFYGFITHAIFEI